MQRNCDGNGRRRRTASGAYRGLCLAIFLLASLAQRSWAAPPPEVLVRAGTQIPVRNGAWTLFNGRVINHSEDDFSGVLVINWVGNMNVQYSTPVWVPARSVIQRPLPVFSRDLDPTERAANYDVRLLDAAPGSDQVISRDNPSVLADDGDYPTAVYMDHEDEESPRVMSTLRVMGSRKPKAVYFDRKSFPTTVLGLLSFTELIVSSGENLSTSQAMAIREWVHRGGHLWIMGDRANRDLARTILGEQFTCEYVGETELPEVEITGFETDHAAGSTAPVKPTKLSYEQPIKFVRLAGVNGWEVTQTIEGWPAVMWHNLGRGSVLITTFSPRVLEGENPKELADWVHMLSDRFFVISRGFSQTMGGGAPVVDAMHELASSIVGHEVVHRGPVMGILLGLCVAIAGAGWWLGRGRRLELLAPTALGVAFLTTVAMLGLGVVNKGSTPLTLAAMGHARVIVPATGGRMNFNGAADVYSPSSFDGSLVAARGTWIVPELRSQAGHVVRMQWSDLSPMRWDHLQFLAATMRAQVGGTIATGKRISATGTFTEQGFEGEIEGISLDKNLDSIIAGGAGRLSPRFVSDTKFIAGEGERLTGKEVVTSGAISVARAHRIDAMQAAVPFTSNPIEFFTWTTGIDADVKVEAAAGATLPRMERQVLTLASVPLEIRRPPEGSTFTIPNNFLGLSYPRLPPLPVSYALYIKNTGLYAGNGPNENGVGNAIFSISRYQIPRELLPLELQEATLRLHFDAAGRDIRIFAPQPGKRGQEAIKVIHTQNGATAPIVLDLAKFPEMKPDADGAIYVGIEVGSHPDMLSFWHIKDISLTIKAKAVGK